MPLNTRSRLLVSLLFFSHTTCKEVFTGYDIACFAGVDPCGERRKIGTGSQSSAYLGGYQIMVLFLGKDDNNPSIWNLNAKTGMEGLTRTSNRLHGP